MVGFVPEKTTFSPEVAEAIKFYVYRLIDPRNGETFYVGKGKNNRVFQHLYQKEMMPGEEDLKYQRIKEIRAAGLVVIPVIHRHGIENEDAAYAIEAALIDAYPGLSNFQSGHDEGDYGCRHVKEIINEYESPVFEPDEPLILISVRRSFLLADKSIYDAVRGTWRINIDKAKKYQLVLAHNGGLVIGAFRPQKWLKATKENFPWLLSDEDRYGFEGVEAEAEVLSRYVNKRVPEKHRRRGAANPVRYVEIKE